MKNKTISLKEKGITLLALVVTIVVLLILAGVTINLALNNNGIINRAKEAEATYKKASQDEELEMIKAEWEMKQYEGGNQSIADFLASKKTNGSIDDFSDLEDGLYLITKDGRKMVLDIGQVTVWDGTSVSTSLQGSGTEEDPFLIRNAEDFRFLQNALSNNNASYNKAYYKQVRDIQFNDTSNFENWDTQNSGLNNCFSTGYFMGQYDGEGHTITGLYINTNEYSAGLFQYVYSAQDSNSNYTSEGRVKNLKVDKAYVKGDDAVGIITGMGSQRATIENCEVNGKVIGEWAVAGIAGCVYKGPGNEGSKVINCKNFAEVRGTTYVGGITGQTSVSEIVGCENHGMIWGRQTVGGIAGESGSAMYNCTNTAKIESQGDDNFYYFAGIAGYFYGANISNSSNSGNIVVHDAGKTSSQIGGVIGIASGSNIMLDNCTNSGNIDSSCADIGGVVGQSVFSESNKANFIIKNCSNTGKKVSSQSILPLVGKGPYTVQ